MDCLANFPPPFLYHLDRWDVQHVMKRTIVGFISGASCSILTPVVCVFRWTHYSGLSSSSESPPWQWESRHGRFPEDLRWWVLASQVSLCCWGGVGGWITHSPLPPPPIPRCFIKCTFPPEWPCESTDCWEEIAQKNTYHIFPLRRLLNKNALLISVCRRAVEGPLPCATKRLQSIVLKRPRFPNGRGRCRRFCCFSL